MVVQAAHINNGIHREQWAVTGNSVCLSVNFKLQMARKDEPGLENYG